MHSYLEISTLLHLVAGLLATGAVAGLLAGLLGVGGGIVIVPVLFWLFGLLGVPAHLSMHLAVATSLATIIPTSIASARAHNARGALDCGLLRALGPGVAAGAAIGGGLARFLDADQLTAIFGAVAVLVAVNMALPRKRALAADLPGPVGRGAIGGGIGLLSALMGIGGGTLSVPAMTLCSVPVHRAVGTASALGLIIAVPGVLGFVWAGWGLADRPPLSLGYVNLPAAVLIFSTTTLTALLGARLAHAINPVRLRQAFAAFLALTALRMLIGG